MNAPPEMNRGTLKRMQKAAAPLLEPDETVLYGSINLTMPAWLSLVLLGEHVSWPHAFQNRSIAVVTERNVYVLRWSGLGKASEVLLKAPLGSVESHVGGRAFPGRYLMIGDQKIWLDSGRKLQAVARAVASAASSQKKSPQPA